MSIEQASGHRSARQVDPAIRAWDPMPSDDLIDMMRPQMIVDARSVVRRHPFGPHDCTDGTPSWEASCREGACGVWLLRILGVAPLDEDGRDITPNEFHYDSGRGAA